MILTLISALAVWAVFAPAGQAAAPGSAVKGFGTQGKTLTGFASAPVAGNVVDMKARPDGSSVALGFTNRRFVLGKFKSDGTPDPAFGIDGFSSGLMVNGSYFFGAQLELQSDGKILVGGTVDPTRGPSVIARFGTNGKLDPSFGDGGTVTGAQSDIRLLAVDQADRLIAVTSTGDQTIVSRFLPDGTADNSFGDGGSVTHSFTGSSGFSDISLAANRITITTPYTTLRLMPNGDADSGFGPGGVSGVGGQSMAVQPDGKVVLAQATFQVTRLLTTGQLDPGFGEGGTATTNYSGASNAVAIDGLGRIVIGGINLNYGPTAPRDFEVIRMTPDGDMDASFSGDGKVTTAFGAGEEDTISAIALRPEGKILAAGTSVSPGRGRFSLARYDSSGTLDPSFGSGTGKVSVAPVLPSDDIVFDSARGPGDTIVAVGRSGPKAAIARYDRNGRLDPEFGDGGRLTTRFSTSLSGDIAERVVVQPDGGLGICASSGAGSVVARFTSTGAPVNEFGQDGTVALPSFRRCYSLRPGSDGELIVGGVGTDNIARLANITGEGELDTSYGESGIVQGPQFSPSGGGIRTMAVDLAPNGDAVLAGDRFGVTVARFTPEGKPRQSFGNKGVLRLDGFRGSEFRMGRAEAIDVAPNGQIAIGGVQAKKLAIARLKPNGTPVKSFGKKGLITRTVDEKSVIRDLRLLGNGSVIGVGHALGTCQFFRQKCPGKVLVVRYLKNGKADRKFGRKGLVLRKIDLDSRGTSAVVLKRSITVSGYAETATGGREFLLTRLRR